MLQLDSKIASNPSLSSDKSLWSTFLADLRLEFSQEVLDKWLNKLELCSISDSEVIMSVSSKFLRDWIKREYLDNGIKKLWQNLMPSLKKVSVIYIESEKKDLLEVVSDNLVNLSKYNNIFTLGTELNPKFTFENFVVGKSNKLAHGMAGVVAGISNPSIVATDINPLFLYGGVGLGKTHLGQAIAWHIKENNPKSKVVYLSAEKFMHQFVQSLRNKDVMEFKEKFRSIDLLIIDDLQFVIGKEGTQEEILHTLNNLVESNKRVVLICDRSPGDLNNIGEKLKSKIAAGMVVDFKCPDYETRLAILKSKRAASDVVVKDEILDLLASKINSSVRDLEGAFKKLVANQFFTDEEINLTNAKNLLQDLFRTNHQGITIDVIQKQVAEYFNIKLADLKSTDRSRNFARPRQIAMYLAKNLTTKSLPDIGYEFGGKNHATVIHSVKKVADLMFKDNAFAADVCNIEEKLK